MLQELEERFIWEIGTDKHEDSFLFKIMRFQQHWALRDALHSAMARAFASRGQGQVLMQFDYQDSSENKTG